MNKRFIITLGAVLMVAATALQLPVFATPGDGNIKDNDTWVFVCKYVGKPGVDETLKEGKQPIRVKSAATVGTWFNDAQGRSYVLDISTDANTDKQGNDYLGDKVCPSTQTTTASISYDVVCDESGAVVVVAGNTGSASGTIVIEGETVTIAAGATAERSFASGTEITVELNGEIDTAVYTCATDEPEEPGRGNNGGQTPTTPSTPATPASTTGTGATTTVAVPSSLPTTSGDNTGAVLAIIAGIGTLVTAVGYAARAAMRRYI